MFVGAHILLYSTSPEADRRFFSEILGFKSVDVGGGWLIFKLPPAEAAVHPAGRTSTEEHAGHDLARAVVYLMCTNIDSTVASLKARGVRCTDIERESWGIRTTIPLPGGAEIGLYQPTHQTALELD
jgi:catechol 2,3-dioxygenase-like lactoylglutathione lyase family enzyme